MSKVVEKNVEDETPNLEALAREGARRMLPTTPEAEVAEDITADEGERDEDGHAVVVRNGRKQARTIVTGSGTIEIEAPRVNDKRVIEGERQRFTSRILPPYMRRSPKVDEVLPIFYLRGLST
ncbi:MAG: transposase [Candidatus Binatia bacterium]|nr:transposase [Candidatus Binatia bacterium]